MEEANKAENVVESKLGRQASELFNALSKQKPARADAIVFLQGDQLDRAEATASLYRDGFSDLVMITGNNVLIGADTRPDENDFGLDVLKKYLIDHGVPAKNIMIEDKSMNSRDQAENIIRIAKEKNWSAILVAVSEYHMLRAYLALVKQVMVQNWSGKIIMHGIKFPWDSIPSGRSKTVLEMLELETEKIKKYAKDIASIQDAASMIY